MGERDVWMRSSSAPRSSKCRSLALLAGWFCSFAFHFLFQEEMSPLSRDALFTYVQLSEQNTTLPPSVWRQDHEIQVKGILIAGVVSGTSTVSVLISVWLIRQAPAFATLKNKPVWPRGNLRISPMTSATASSTLLPPFSPSEFTELRPAPAWPCSATWAGVPRLPNATEVLPYHQQLCACFGPLFLSIHPPHWQGIVLELL